MNNVRAKITVKIPLLKKLQGEGFPLNVGALTLTCEDRNLILDSVNTNWSNTKKHILVTTDLVIDKETFEEGEEYNYKLVEQDLIDKKLKATFHCGDEDYNVDEAFDFDNAVIECAVYVEGYQFNIKGVTFE